MAYYAGWLILGGTLMTYRTARILILVAIVCLIVGGSAVQAQQKTAKQAESLSKSADSAKKQVSGVVEHLGKMLQGYNSIIDGSAKNPQSAYKKLAGDLKSTEKMLQGAQKSLQALNKEAGKFFTDWEKDLGDFSNEDLKQKSMARLEKSKGEYKALGEALGQAGEAFGPLVQNLNDQILFLGRDLSPEAIQDLQGEAEALNTQAKDVTEEVKSLVASADAKPVATD
jgi:uncharacterized protein YoxC